MKKLLTLFFVLSFGLVSISYAQETVKKTFCMSAVGYQSGIDNLKRELLNNAKREAVSELFGELIKSFTKIENFKLTKDKMLAASVGFVRIKGDPVYYQGENLGELCVKIEAYAKEEDFQKFKPKVLTKKSCIAEGDVKTITKRTQEQARLEALIDYDQTLKKYPSEQILPLLHEVSFSDAGFIASTLVYCTKVRGTVYPIEIAALTEMPSEPLATKRKQLKDDERKTALLTSTETHVEPPKTGTLFKDFRDLRIEFEHLQVTNEHNVIVFLRYINKTKKDLKIVLSQGNEGSAGGYVKYYPTYMTDDKETNIA